MKMNNKTDFDLEQFIEYLKVDIKNEDIDYSYYESELTVKEKDLIKEYLEKNNESATRELLINQIEKNAHNYKITNNNFYLEKYRSLVLDLLIMTLEEGKKKNGNII